MKEDMEENKLIKKNYYVQTDLATNNISIVEEKKNYEKKFLILFA